MNDSEILLEIKKIAEEAQAMVKDVETEEDKEKVRAKLAEMKPYGDILANR